MDKIITTRVPEDFLKELKDIAKRENLDTSTIISRLLLKSMKELRIKNCLDKLREHKISIGKAAEECDISIWDIIDLAKENNIDWVDYSEDDLESDLKYLRSFK